MPLRQPALCADIPGANEGDTVQWQNPTVDCTVSQYGTTTFPFCSSPPSNPPNSINIKPAPPAPAPSVIICVPAGTYQFVISCCTIPVDNAVHTVTVE